MRIEIVERGFLNEPFPEVFDSQDLVIGVRQTGFNEIYSNYIPNAK